MVKSIIIHSQELGCCHKFTVHLCIDVRNYQASLGPTRVRGGITMLGLPKPYQVTKFSETAP